MIRGIGVDICQKTRFAKLELEKWAAKILTQAELAVFNLKPDGAKQSFIAKRFACKEAFAKALGCGIGGEFAPGKALKFKDFEVLNNHAGAPYVNLCSEALGGLGLKVFVSISDEAESVIAFVILEKVDGREVNMG